jgi:YhcH/YjgK/YiaL family protein
MKNNKLVLLLLVIFSSTTHLMAQGGMSKAEADKWFDKKAWLGGAPLTPSEGINKEEFARQYKINKVYWDKAFAFLKVHDLKTIATGKYPIDSTNVFATVTEDPSKDFDKTQWESHRKYVDLQCVISGEEKMGKYPVAKATVTKPYDVTKDVANYSAEGNFYIVPAGSFIIFFPLDAHRPNITPGGNKVVKKIVIKIRAAE